MENKTKYREQVLGWERNIHALRKKYRNTPVGYQSTQQEAESETSLKKLEAGIAETKKSKILNQPIGQIQMFAGRKKNCGRSKKSCSRNTLCCFMESAELAKVLLHVFMDMKNRSREQEYCF